MSNTSDNNRDQERQQRRDVLRRKDQDRNNRDGTPRAPRNTPYQRKKLTDLNMLDEEDDFYDDYLDELV